MYKSKNHKKNIIKFLSVRQKKAGSKTAFCIVCILLLLLSNGFSVGVSLVNEKRGFSPHIQIPDSHNNILRKESEYLLESNKERNVPLVGNTGYEPYFFYIGGIINSANGNLYLTDTDLSIEARGFPIEIIRAYNSYNMNLSSPFGFGWTFTYNTYLLDYTEYILWVDGDGSIHNFSSLGAGGYQSPSGLALDLKKHLDQTYSLRRSDGTKYKFDAIGRLQYIEDNNGNRLSCTYEGYNLIQIIDDSGLFLNFSYNQRNKITQIIDTLGRTISYDYNIYNDLIEVIDSMGYSTRYTYANCHRLVSSIDKANVSITFSYLDDSSKVNDVRKGVYDGQQQAYQNAYLLYFIVYDSVNRTTYYLNANNYASAIQYNTQGNPTKFIDSLGGTLLIAWEDNQILNLTDKNGNTHYSDYDSYGNIIKEIDALGYELFYDWSIINTSSRYQFQIQNMTKVAYDPIGDLVQIFFDSFDPTPLPGWQPSPQWLLCQTQFQSAPNSYGCIYNGIGLGWDETLDSPLIDVSNYTNVQLSFWHKREFEDPLNLFDGGNVKVSSDGGTNWMLVTPTNGYDGKIVYGRGNPLEVQKAFGHHKDWKYETVDLTPYVGRSDKLIIRFEMGTDTFPSSPIDTGWYIDDVKISGYLISKRNITMNVSYDSNGNVIQITDYRGNSTFFDYDPHGNLVNYTDFRGYTTRIEYDMHGYVRNITDPLGNSTKLYYDNAGRLTNATNANNNTFSQVFDNNDNIIRVIDPTNNITEFFYNPNGALLRIIDANGHQTNYTTTVNGRIEQVQDPSGNSTYYTYSRSGDPVKTIDEQGKTTEIGYDPLGRPISETDPLGNTEWYGYDTEGNLVYVMDKNYAITSYEYDKLNRLMRSIDPYGDEIVYSYDEFGNLANIRDKNNHNTGYEYDELNRITKIIDDSGCGCQQTIFDYDQNGNRISITDANYYTTHYVYDEIGRLTALIDPLGNTTQYTYDAVGNVKEITDKKGNTNHFEYDSLNRLIKYTDPLGNFTQYTYDPVGNLLSVRDPRGYSTQYSYDSLDRLVHLTDASGNSTSYHYDSLGNLIQMIDAENQKINFSYDALNRVQQSTDASGYTTTYVYDAVGNLIQIQDGNGNTMNYWYDAMYRIIQSGSTQENDYLWYSYDGNGNLVSVTDANNQQVSFYYDVLDRLYSISYPSGTEYYTYDNAGNIISRIDENGTITNYTYDALNQLQTIDYPQGTVVFTYDANGNIILAENQNLGLNDSICREYDALNRLKKTTVDFGLFNKTIDYTYDEAGNILTMRNPQQGLTTYSYDPMNRLVSMTDPAQEVTTFFYDTVGRLIRKIFPNSVYTNFSYDLTGNLLETVTKQANHSVIARFVYTYDGVGNRLNVTDVFGHTTEYVYDDIYRLQEVTYGPAGTNVKYTYDGAGNRMTKFINNSILYYYQYSSDNKMTFDGNDWYYYDSRGNLIQKDTLAGSYQYQYDTENRLSKVTLPNASTIDYYYSPFGDRIGRITATEQIYYLYDGSDILQEYNLSGTNQALYTHGHVKGSGFNEPISLTRDGTKAFYHTDGLGSIVAMTDSVQTVINKYTYNDFGEIAIGTELIHNTHTYTAKEYDQETGLYFYRSRYYQPDIGRFIQKDIFGTIDGMNQYIYVHNNPVNFIDPCGRKANPGWRIGDFRTGPYNDEENLGIKIEEAKAAYDADLEKCKDDQKELKRTLTRSSTHNRNMKKWNAIKAGANALPLKGPLKWSVDIHIAIGDTMAEIPATEPLFSCKAVGIFLRNLFGIAKDKAEDTAQDAVLEGLGEMGDGIGKGLEFLDTVQNIKEFIDAMKELSNTDNDAKKIDQALKNFLSKCKERAKQKFKDAVNAAKLSKVVITGQKPSTFTANTPPIPKPQPIPSSGQQPPKPQITGGGETPDPPDPLPPPDEDGPSQQGVQTTGHRPLEPETTPTLPIPVTTPDPPWINRLPRITTNPTDDSIGFPPGGGGDLGIPSPEEYCEYRLVYFSSNAITNMGSNHQALYNAIKWAARHPPSVNTTVLLMPSWAGYDGYSQWQTFISQYPGILLLRWSNLSLERELVTYSGLQQIGADVLIDNEHYSSIQQGGFYSAMETEAIQKYLLDEHGYVVTSTTLGDNSGQLNQTDQLLALLGLEKKNGEPHLFVNSNPWILDDPVHAIFYNISSGWDPGVVTGNVDTGACPLCGEKHYGTQIAHLESTQGSHHALISAYTLWYVPFSTNGIVSEAGSACISVPQTVYFPNQIITDAGNNHDALYKAIKWAAEQTDDQETRVLMMPGWGGYDGWSQWQSFAGTYSDLNITRWSSQSSSRDVVTTYGLDARAADILIMDNHSNPLQQGGYYTQGELQAINWYIKTKGHGLIVTSQTLGQDSGQNNQTTVLMKLLEINNTGTIEPYTNSEPWIIDQPYHPILYGINTWNPGTVTGNLVTETAIQLAHLYTTQGNHHTIVSAYEGFEKGVCSCLCNIPPLADFTWAPPTPAPQDSIQFSDLSEDIDGFLVNWSWDFGDGSKSYIQNPTHHYNALGKYSVCLTVIDDGGVSDRFSQDVDVVDLFAPEFSNIVAHPSAQNIGGFVNISATVIDTVGVDEVYLFIEYPDLVEQNFSITQNKTGDTYYCNQSYSQIGSYFYQLWANDTSRNSNTSQIFTFQIVSSTNNPPLLGTPTPNNGSTNQPFSFTWSIPISDPEGDLFSWTIQCSNGQSNSGTGATNGTKTLDLAGLAGSTTYTVWVNATDPGGSDQYTRQWYTFTTKVNQPPIFGSSSPTNGSINQPLSLTWSIPINDPEGNTFSWTIQCNNGQFNSGTNAGNGTKTLTLSGLEYSTTYTIWVNATDPGGSGQYTRRWYLFTTKTSLPPIFATPSPVNGSTNQPLSITWSIPISDPEGDQFSWTIQCSNGQSNSATGASNGTKTLQLAGLSGSTTYTVWVNATDPGGSGQYTRKWYTFTTQQQQNSAPNKPATPQGTTSGKLNTPYVYWSSTTDPDGNQVYYQWDWGDGSTSAWLGPYNSGAQINTTHTWTVKSSSVKIKAKDAFGLESPWSDPLPITMPFSLRPQPLLQLIESILERFPRAFPVLRHLMRY